MRRVLQKSWAAVRLLFYLHYELIRSNREVARNVLRPLNKLAPRVIAVPTEAVSEIEAVVLANLITLTPGTFTIEISADWQTLYVHAMNAEDAEEVREQIRSGFGRLVREVFS